MTIQADVPDFFIRQAIEVALCEGTTVDFIIAPLHEVPPLTERDK